MLRYLRIAVSVLSLVACMLLIALWARSNTWADSVSGGFIPQRAFSVWSERGVIRFTYIHTPSQIQWRFRTAVAYLSRSGFSRYYYFWPPPQITYHVQAAVPYGLPVILTGILAAVFGIRRPFQFSLRTLLIAMTIIAVWLGLIVSLI